MENIILIGMPASGKSTAGVLIAKKIGYGFIDTDLLIQKREGMLLCDILSLYGTEGFIKIEECVNAELVAERCVVATGGSVIYGDRAMQNVMRKNGETIAELMAERAPLYEKYADITINCDELSLDETVDAVVRAAGL